jgi:hypothetical protein
MSTSARKSASPAPAVGKKAAPAKTASKTAPKAASKPVSKPAARPAAKPVAKAPGKAVTKAVTKAVATKPAAKVPAVKTPAKTPALRTNSREVMLARVEAVRLQQRVEGNFDCFGRAADGYCDQGSCTYHAECLSVSRLLHSL